MRHVLLCTAAILLIAAPARTQDPIEEPLWKKIDKAIDDGVEWLKGRQKDTGDWGESNGPTYGPGKAYHNRPGIAALALLALLKSGVPPKDPVIRKGVMAVYEYVGNKGNLISNYDRGVILMMIESLYEGMVAEKMKKKGKKVKERVGDFKEPKYSLSGSDRAVVSAIVKALVAEQTQEGGWRYGKGFGLVGSAEDTSATQIVLLGLKSALRMRVGVPPQVFMKALSFVMGMQETDGPKVERPGGTESKSGDRGTYASMGEDRARGWKYIKNGSKPEETEISGGMTCAGIGGLLIIKSVIDKKLPKKMRAKVEQCIYDGFAWLFTKWTVDGNPGYANKNRHYYYLYGIERVCTLGMYEKIGKHWWYKEGAELLVKQQKGDGHWDTKREIVPSDIIDTSLALLFLKRGTVPIGDVMTPRVKK